MPTYEIEIPGRGKFRIESPSELSDQQAYQAAFQQADMQRMADPTSGMSFVDKSLSGAGKAFADIGLGVRQIVGNASQQEVDDRTALDAPLMNTGAGIAGNIAGQVGMTLLPGLGLSGAGANLGRASLTAAGKRLLASPATLGGALTQAGLGATQAGLQPVESGASRGVNASIGAAGGALVPAAGMALKGTKAALEPLYQGGRNNIIGRSMRQAAGQNADAVANRLANPQVLVPGSSPTAAEVANSGGIAAMQRAAAAVDPEAYATRAAQQNEARVAALTDLAGTSGQREFYDASRKTAANELYEKAYQKGVDIIRNQTTGTFLPKSEVSGVRGEITKLLKRPAIKDAVKSARVLAANEGVNLRKPAGSVKGLDYVKRALDDQISKTTGNEQRVLTDLKHRLLTTIDRLSPDYAQARMTFQEMSKPINQMDIAQTIADKSINKLTGQLQPAAYARALTDDTAASATGFSKATLDNIFEPPQLGILGGIKDDLARSVAARDLGRGAGSDTVQKLAMTNLMQRSGLPVGLLNVPGLGRAGQWAYSVADEKMMADLAKALLTPQEAAQLMRGALPNRKLQALQAGLLSAGAPLSIGITTGLLNAP